MHSQRNLWIRFIGHCGFHIRIVQLQHGLADGTAAVVDGYRGCSGGGRELAGMSPEDGSDRFQHDKGTQNVTSIR
jgi:hypothetical protein